MNPRPRKGRKNLPRRVRLEAAPLRPLKDVKDVGGMVAALDFES